MLVSQTKIKEKKIMPCLLWVFFFEPKTKTRELAYILSRSRYLISATAVKPPCLS